MILPIHFQGPTTFHRQRVGPFPLTHKQQELIALAKATIRDEVLGKKLPNPKGKDPVRPIFITIEHNGRILGCRGDLTTQTPSLETEIVREAANAAEYDPRYRPLTPQSIKSFLVTITIVKHEEPINNVNRLLPSDGLILVSGNRTGIVLPWEGKDPHLRLKWAYEKAGVPIGSMANLYLLQGVRFRG